jgi:glyoxylase-like metal-dependent hydrolase (beta-lactamase superfamily II)/rhodanese-related sulfurtransferase
MKVEQIYTGCLAQGAYYIESDGEAAIIDPMRETKPYLEKLDREKAKLKYIFETHFHADFVSGHVDLSKKTGAPIIYGPTAQTSFESYIAKDLEEFKIGRLTIRVLHTPGHTPESTSYLLFDESGKEYCIFSGDTLFIGDVGRPDLAQKATGLTEEDLAGWLFDSLRNKIMTLPDDIIVYPAHGAGSACGKNMSDDTWDSLGHQKETNYALRPDMTREEFIKEVAHGLLPPPIYFAENVRLNKEGYGSIDKVIEQGTRGLNPKDFANAAHATEALILDTRHQDEFVLGHIPGSIFIGLDGDFAPWVGNLIPDMKQEILVITEEGREEEAVTRLARVGFNNTIGYLKGGIDAWKKAGKDWDTLESITPEEFEKRINSNKVDKILDVRKPTEFLTQRIADAVNFPLDYINNNMNRLSKRDEYYIHCAGGYRSVIAASILKARGYGNLIDVKEGWEKIEEVTNISRTDYACPTEMNQETIDDFVKTVI